MPMHTLVQVVMDMNLLGPLVIRLHHSPLLSIPLRLFLFLKIFHCCSEYHSNKSSFENQEKLKFSRKATWYSPTLESLDREYLPSLHHSPIERSPQSILSNSHLHLLAKISNRSNKDWSIFSANIRKKHLGIYFIFSSLSLRDSANPSGKSRHESILNKQQVPSHEKSVNTSFILFLMLPPSCSLKDAHEMNLSLPEVWIQTKYRIKHVNRRSLRISILHEKFSI